MSDRAERVIVPTSWRRPALLLAWLNAAAAAMPPSAEMVLAVPHEPGPSDAEAARTVLSAGTAAARSMSVTVESFSEVLSKSYSLAVILAGEPEEMWEAFAVALADVTRLQALPTRPGSGLHSTLQDFTEDAPKTSVAPVPSTAGADAWSSYLGGGLTLVRLAWGGKVCVPTSHVRLLGMLLDDGRFEPALTGYLVRTLQPGQTVVDVGANIGLHTTLMGTVVGYGGAVIAYEPFPDNLACLEKSVAASSLIGLVDIRSCAASDAAASVSMTVSDVWRGQGTIAHSTLEVLPGVVDEHAYSIQVQTVRLDDDLADVPRIHLVKVDVEGAEERVFAGMEGLLTAGRIDRVAFECYRHHLGDEWPAFAHRLTRMSLIGWKFRILDEVGTDYEVPVTSVVEHGNFETVIIERPGLT